MDIQTIILITIINAIMTGLVGGIIIYVLRKKIDAAIQKSLFEHQIKFPKIYPKTLEVLEAYTQKVINCSRLSYALGYVVLELNSGVPTLEADEIETRQNELVREFRNLQTFFQDNHLYLPEGYIAELSEINQKVFNLGIVTTANVKFPAASQETVAEHLDLSSKFLGVTIEEGGFAQLIYSLKEEFDKLIKRLDEIYKSLAETK